MNKIPEHIKLIYICALKLKAPLIKMIWCGYGNVYNRGDIFAAYFVQTHLIDNSSQLQQEDWWAEYNDSAR